MPLKVLMDAAQQLQAFQAVVHRGDAVRAQLAAAARQTQVQLDAAWAALGAALVPGLDHAALAQAAGRLGDPTLEPQAWDAIVAQEDARLAQLAAEVAQGGADPTGEAAVAEAEAARLEEWLAGVKAGVARREADSAFVAALQRAEQRRWWSMRWQLANRRAQGLLRQHGSGLGIQTLEALLEMHRAQRAILAELEAQRSQAARLRALWRSRAQRAVQLDEARASVGARLLEQARAEACRAFHQLQPAQRAACLVDWPQARAAALPVEGLDARQRYLDALREHLLGPALQQAHKDAQRAAYLLEHGMGGVVFSSADQTADLARRVEDAARLATALLEFDRFDTVDLAAHPLWWDWFLDGQESGTFIPEVAAFRAEHRGRAFLRTAPPPPPTARDDPFYREGRAALLGKPGDHHRDDDET